MKCSLCIDLLYLEIGPTGPVFSDTNKSPFRYTLYATTQFRLESSESSDWLEIGAIVRSVMCNAVLCAKIQDTFQHTKIIKNNFFIL